MKTAGFLLLGAACLGAGYWQAQLKKEKKQQVEAFLSAAAQPAKSKPRWFQDKLALFPEGQPSKESQTLRDSQVEVASQSEDGTIAVSKGDSHFSPSQVMIAQKQPFPASTRLGLNAEGGVEDIASVAARVEQEANHELANLLKHVDLSPEEQDRVFTQLARNSSSYRPYFDLQTPTQTSEHQAASSPKSSDLLANTPQTPPSSAQAEENYDWRPYVTEEIPVAVTDPLAEARENGLIETTPDEEIAMSLPSEKGNDVKNYISERNEWWQGVVERFAEELSLDLNAVAKEATE